VSSGEISRKRSGGESAGSGLRLRVAGDGARGRRGRGETVVGRVSARGDRVGVALTLAATSRTDGRTASAGADGGRTTSTRADGWSELLEPLVLHDTADVLAQGFVEPGRVDLALLVIGGEVDARSRRNDGSRIGRDKERGVALSDNTKSCPGRGLVE